MRSPITTELHKKQLALTGNHKATSLHLLAQLMNASALDSILHIQNNNA